MWQDASAIGDTVGWYRDQLDLQVDQVAATTSPFDVSPYGLIFWLGPTIKPDWWDVVTGMPAGWSGRVVIVGDSTGLYLGQSFWNSDIQPLTGFHINSDFYDPSCDASRHCPVVATDLTSFPTFSYTYLLDRDTCSFTLSGGAVLVANDFSGTHVMIARQTIGAVDYVAVGNQFVFANCAYVNPVTPTGLPNEQFVSNLWTVPV